MKQQRGIALLAVVMIVLLVVSMGLLAYTMGKKDMQIGYAYTQHNKAFYTADALFQDVFYIVKQLVDAPQAVDNPDEHNIFWNSDALAKKFNPTEDNKKAIVPQYGDYRFINKIFADNNEALTCEGVNKWLDKEDFTRVRLKCDDFGSDDARIILEYQTSVGERREVYRVTVYGRGYNGVGFNMAQGSASREYTVDS